MYMSESNRIPRARISVTRKLVKVVTEEISFVAVLVLFTVII